MSNAIAPSTRATYQRAMTVFQDFYHKIYHTPATLPFNTDDLKLFIAFSYSQQLTSTTVSTYLSALSYFHKLQNFADPTQSFLVKKCMQGYQKLTAKPDVRLPITQTVLRKLVYALDFTVSCAFHRLMLKAMYLLAFHAFLRVGEFTSTGHNVILQYEDVSFQHSGHQIVGVEIRFRQYKHSRTRQPVLFIPCCNDNIGQCPVHTLDQFFTIRKPESGALFSFMDNTPVSRSFFTTQLRASAQFAGLPHSNIKGHSFRIGAATTAASMGIPEEKIQLMGRWSSNAYKKYIRIPVLKL